MKAFRNYTTSNYWQDRYEQGDIPWDLGKISPPIKNYMDEVDDKELCILIPGAGHAYEAAYLHQQGFTNVYVADIAAAPLAAFKKSHPTFPAAHLLHQDFFTLDIQFDLIIEQTFFCALPPNLRPAYVVKMKQLLRSSGALIGLLFDAPLYEDHPPFGGSSNEYKALFSPHFTIQKMQRAQDSVPARLGRELFIELIPKKL
ncbi:MAG: methyltransferase domain-containing protein [Dokdonia sp.]|jgi:hypothetical protein